MPQDEVEDFWGPVTDRKTAVDFWWTAVMQTIANSAHGLSFDAAQNKLSLILRNGAEFSLPPAPGTDHELLFRTAGQLTAGRATFSTHGKFSRWNRLSGLLGESLAQWKKTPLQGEMGTQISPWYFVWSATWNPSRRTFTMAFKSVTPDAPEYSQPVAPGQGSTHSDPA